MPGYQLSKRATSDLDGILQFTIRRWGSEQADSYIRELQDCFELLARRPMLGRAADHIRPGLRRFECGSHTVFYRVSSARVSITRVLHESMRPLPSRLGN
jgi:toxin ParE1/3/4